MKRTALIAVSAVLVTGFFLARYDCGSVAAQTKTPSPTPTPVSAPRLGTPTPSPKPTETPEEIIRVETELVNLNVRVIDRNGRPINNVQQKDIRIYEDGVLQQIEFFDKAEVPTNYGIVVDNSGSMRQQLDKVVEAGKILVNTNRPADESMIIRFVGRDKIEIEQPFTSNKVDLIDALDNLYIEGGQTAIIDAVYLAVENIDEYEKEKNAIEKKRRALILVSDGEDRNSYYNEKQLFELLKESEVQIFVIGFVDDLSKEGGFISKSPQAKAKAFLERIATETGGKAYFPSSPSVLPELANAISNELRTQYSIGYIPSNDRKDNSFRNIKVQVDDGPNAQKRIAVYKAGRVAE
ncbi:MAG TPA: VWA domain-containing protein, partial [Pyrinomonadaceae bacterium]|nr:VWA domain-containing protein [Pyrinomonadaceae bacterium]